MRTKERNREYMRQYRLRSRKEPETLNRPGIVPKTRIERPLRACDTPYKGKYWLAEKCNTKVFNVTMCNPQNNSRLTFYGTQKGLEILGKNGFMIVKE